MKLLLLLLFFILFYCYYKFNIFENFIQDDNYLLRLKYKLLGSFHKVMTLNEIDYSIGSRTLEAAVSSEQLNKDNAQETIYIKINDLPLFLNIKFQDYGLYLEDRKDNTFYLTLSDMKTVGRYPSAAIHILPLTFTGDRWILQNRKSYSYDEFFYKGDLFPSKQYAVHHEFCKGPGCSMKSLSLSGPRNPNEYLSR